MSVVVIALNEENRVVDCLSALLNQVTTRSFEVVFVDDGSTDATLDLVRGLGDNRIQVVALPANVGRGRARQAGIASAAGRDVAFVDADIVVPAHWLESVCDALGGAAAAGGVAVPDGDIAPLARMFALTPKAVPASGAVAGSNVVFDGDVLRNLVFPMTRLGEDFRLVRQLQQAGHHLVNLPDLVVEHHESRSWSGFVRWLYRSGEDASSLLSEFREFRTPDLVWTTANVIVVSAAATGFMVAGVPAACAAAAAAAVAVSAAAAAGHVITRFEPRPPVLLAAACAAHVVPMAAYLTGRNVGAAGLLARKVRARVRR